MSEEKSGSWIKVQNRVLGDEWLDWDGSTNTSTANTRKRVFLGFCVLTVAAVILAAALFAWLLEPRLGQIWPSLVDLVRYAVYGLALILVLWLALFIIAALFNLRLFAPFLILPRLVNVLLNITILLGQVVGISKDRMTNSFLKAHNLVLRFKYPPIRPQELLVLLPRCLKRDYFAGMRSLREKYQFQMLTVGGGQEARQKIRAMCPRAIIAVACERDLLSGFIEVNPKIPVMGFPNTRPEGPCRNTEIDLTQVESAVRHFLVPEPVAHHRAAAL